MKIRFVRTMFTVIIMFSVLIGPFQLAGLKFVNAEQAGKYYVAVYTTTTPYYTNTMVANGVRNVPKETQSVYFAVSSDGKNYEYLNNNSGVIFAKEGSMRLVSPRIVKSGSTFFVYAMDNTESKGVHIFKSIDGVVYDSETLSTDSKDINVINNTSALKSSSVSGFPNDENLSLGNAIEITKSEYDYINNKLGTVTNTGLQRVENLSTTVGTAITEEKLSEKIPNVTAEYSDGSTQDFQIDWSGALDEVDFNTAGNYTVYGEVVQTKYLSESEDDNDNTVFIEGLADPYIYYDDKTGYYYCTGSYFPSDEEKNAEEDSPYYGAQSYDRIVLRRSKTLEGLRDRSGQVTIWKAGNQLWYKDENDATGSDGYRYIWAPEIHRVGDNWVVYFTESESETSLYGIRCHALILDGDLNPYDTALSAYDEKSQWIDYQMSAWENDTTTSVDETSETPFTSTFCLDMTYFKDTANGETYVVWAGKPTIAKGGSSTDLFIAKVNKKEPWKLASNSTRISWSEYGWEEISYYVNEGPSVIQHDGNIFLCYSASGTGSEYSIGMLSATNGDDLLNADNWTKSPYPLLTSKDLDGEEGPGHNSFTVDENGNVIFVYHARPSSHNTKECGSYSSNALEDPCRHARIKRVHWSADGDPILKMTYENELKTVYTTVATTICVGTEAVDDTITTTDYLFTYFPYTKETEKDERIYFATSEDGLNYTALNNGNYVIESKCGTHGLRDPFIIRSHDGSKFYLLATDLTVSGLTQDGVDYPSVTWTEAAQKGSQSIMIWESTDLVNWSKQRMCNVSVDTAGCTWAPEAYYDEENEQYMVFWASSVSDDGYAQFRIYYATTKDFITFSEPELWIDESWSTIDTTVIKVGDYYYRYTKNESTTTNTNGTPTKRIYCERSKSLLGEWELVNNNSMIITGTQIEGPTIFRFNSEDVEQVKYLSSLVDVDLTGDTLYGLYPDLTGRTIVPGVSDDITTGSFQCLGSTKSKTVDGVSVYSMSSPTASHGTVMPITSEEYNNLKLKWDSSYASAAKKVTDKLSSEAFNLSVTVSSDGLSLLLPDKGENGTAVSWISQNPVIVTDDGKITFPKEGEEDLTVIMTATLSSEKQTVDGIELRGQTVTQDFLVTISSSGKVNITKIVNTDNSATTTTTTTTSTKKTTAKSTASKARTKTTRSAKQVAKDKKAAKKAMKQAKITKLKVKSKAKKKITVSWKKVKKAKGYQVQVSKNKKFKKKKIIYDKLTAKKKLVIKGKKIKRKKTYYVRVRAYATYKDKYGKAKKVYSKWNKKLRKVKVK